MAQFLGDIAAILELFAIALGLALLQKASKEAPAKYHVTGAAVLIAGGLLLLLTTAWYWFQYYGANEFQHPDTLRPHMSDHMSESIGHNG